MKNTYCYWIYILECENGNYYTGYTSNLARRYEQHKTGIKGAKFTRSFRPVRIAQCWLLVDSRGTAMKIEHFIKRRDRKIKNIIVNNPGHLKNIISQELNIDIDITPFNPGILKTDT